MRAAGSPNPPQRHAAARRACIEVPRPVDIVLLDIGLPKINGFEAARRIREQSQGKRLLLVALTGWGQAADRRKAREAGFNAHIVKPVDAAVLANLLVEFPVVGPIRLIAVRTT